MEESILRYHAYHIFRLLKPAMDLETFMSEIKRIGGWKNE